MLRYLLRLQLQTVETPQARTLLMPSLLPMNRHWLVLGSFSILPHHPFLLSQTSLFVRVFLGVLFNNVWLTFPTDEDVTSIENCL